jgi:serine protease Do
MAKFSRARLGGAVVVAFTSGVLFASGLDLTPFGWAQNRVAATQPNKPTAQEIAPLVDTQNAFEAIVDKTKPAVVSIHVKKFHDQAVAARGGRGSGPGAPQQNQLPPELRRFFQIPPDGAMPAPDGPESGAGSGFIVSKDGYVLTNNHVVQGADEVTVTTLDKRTHIARVIGRDATTDVAVIKIEGNNFPTLALGNDATTRVGQWVLAIGNPLDLDFTVTAGIISAKGRQSQELAQRMGNYAITDYIQTDAAINPGNSGGPLVDIHGNVIGINSAIATGTGYYAGYGFAIPITLAKEVMDDLIKYGKIRRALIGVSINDLTQDEAEAAGLKDISGAWVIGFTDSTTSPGHRAGIRLGDVIVAANGQPVDKVSTLQRIIRGFEPGQTVDVDVVRFGDKKSFKVRLMEQPSEPTIVAAALPSNGGRGAGDMTGSAAARKLGITIEPVTRESAEALRLPPDHQRGVLVTDVTARSVVLTKLIPKRTIIERSIYPSQRDIRTVADFDQVINSAKSGSVVQFSVFDATSNAGRLISVRIP